MSGELNYHVKDIKKVIAAVKEQYAKDGKEDFTDGYSLESSDWRFNIRPSNTEPLLRLNIEARKTVWSKSSKPKSKRLLNQSLSSGLD